MKLLFVRVLSLPLSPMYELVTRFSRLNTQNILHLLQPQLTKLPHTPHLVHNMPHRLCVHTRQRPQELLRGMVNPTTRPSILLRANRNRLGRVRLKVVRLEVVEYLRRRVRRARPDDAHPRERQREQHQFRLDAVGRHCGAALCAPACGFLLARRLCV